MTFISKICTHMFVHLYACSNIPASIDYSRRTVVSRMLSVVAAIYPSQSVAGLSSTVTCRIGIESQYDLEQRSMQSRFPETHAMCIGLLSVRERSDLIKPLQRRFTS